MRMHRACMCVCVYYLLRRKLSKHLNLPFPIHNSQKVECCNCLLISVKKNPKVCVHVSK